MYYVVKWGIGRCRELLGLLGGKKKDFYGIKIPSNILNESYPQNVNLHPMNLTNDPENLI